MPSDLLYMITLALTWIGYGAAHSLTASSASKRWFAALHPHHVHLYRPLYNFIALALLVPPLGLLLVYPGSSLWHWPAWLGWLMDTAAALAIIAFIASARLYDMEEFTGLGAWRSRQRAVQAPAPMRLLWPHRFVRHPWYSLGLIILWSREMNAAWLLSAVIVTVYILIGSHLEETKLIASWGNQYRRYRAKVPGLVPRPWRYLTKQQAAEILNDTGC